MIQFFAYSSLITAIASFCIGVFVIIKNSKSKLNILWFATSFSVGIWSFGLYREVLSSSENEALFWNRILYVGAIFIPIFLYHFIINLLEIENKRIWLLFVGYIASFVFFILNFTKLFVSGVPSSFGFKYWVKPGPFYYPYFLMFIFYLIFGIYLLISNYKNQKGSKKQQIKYVLIGVTIGFSGGVTNFFPQLINTYPVGNFFVSFYVVMITYAILKYRLMDIRLIISKSILYFILVGTVTLAFTSITFITGQVFTTEGFSKTFVSIFISLIIVLGLDPLKHFLARITDKVFYKDKIDYQDVLKNLGFIIAKEIELKKLFIDLSDGIGKFLKCKNVNFLYQNSVTGMYKGFELGNIFFTKNDEIIEYLKNRKQIIVVEELDRVAKENNKETEKQTLLSIVDRLDKMKIGLIAPIISENQITAILSIEKKLSGDIFSSDDIDLISVLTPQVATALEKSKLYNEIQDLNLHLQEKVEEATLNLRQANIDLETRNKYLTALQKISGVITRSLDFKEVTSFIAASIKKEMDFGAGVINFIDEQSKSIYIGAMTLDEEIKKITDLLPQKPSEYKVSFSDKDNLAIKAMNSGNIEKSSCVYDVFKPAITTEQADKIQKYLNIKSVVAVPMYSENKIIGSIDFFLYKDVTKIRKVDIEVMKALTDQTGLVIKNINLYGELKNKNEELEDANEHL
ncbi:MAG: histidine kinase N-terminal 7TM domain-containing protein, partial [Patescibacteria group bacterium]|nr:histidine kinase N-terminal 7TM domain-containing protein [Patescibacteria group bacterium]